MNLGFCERQRAGQQELKSNEGEKKKKKIKHPPLLHFTVGLAAVIDEARLVAHAIAVNHHAAVQVQAVVAAVREVLLHHAAPETCGQRRVSDCSVDS